MPTPRDDTPEYKESVRAAILSWDPSEGDPEFGGIDESALDLASCYLWWNGYKTDDTITPTVYASSTDNPLGGEGTNFEPAYFVYDVLKWTEQNT